MFEDALFIAPFLASFSHEMFVREYCGLWGGAIVESVVPVVSVHDDFVVVVVDVLT